MKLNRFLLVLGLTAIGLTTASKKANALTWSIGTNSGTFTAPSNYYAGQSFTPNVSGSSGSGTPGATAELQSFTFGSSSSGKLYIYSNLYNGTPSGLSSGSGLVGFSSTADNNGIYNFVNGGLLLSSVSSRFYAYTDSNFSSSYSSDSYSGGSFFGSTGGNFSNFSSIDWNFSATFTDASTQAVPFEFSPTEGIALGLPLFIGLRMLKKRRALKNSTREVDDLTSAR